MATKAEVKRLEALLLATTTALYDLKKSIGSKTATAAKIAGVGHQIVVQPEVKEALAWRREHLNMIKQIDTVPAKVVTRTRKSKPDGFAWNKAIRDMDDTSKYVGKFFADGNTAHKIVDTTARLIVLEDGTKIAKRMLSQDEDGNFVCTVEPISKAQQRKKNKLVHDAITKVTGKSGSKRKPKK